ncbi:hypothetical protein HPB50_022573 [Hyalomma asiaticum]|uniref:Uncharacterized protein n=1 Tax=Hyalomma asiaticum TaxID=266040 RepID=A0ACB7RYG0_HYAAI|nr:hypothetical protein HPB50_022573 [Hyalomma asiaticum]
MTQRRTSRKFDQRIDVPRQRIPNILAKSKTSFSQRENENYHCEQEWCAEKPPACSVTLHPAGKRQPTDGTTCRLATVPVVVSHQSSDHVDRRVVIGQTPFLPARVAAISSEQPPRCRYVTVPLAPDHQPTLCRTVRTLTPTPSAVGYVSRTVRRNRQRGFEPRTPSTPGRLIGPCHAYSATLTSSPLVW